MEEQVKQTTTTADLKSQATQKMDRRLQNRDKDWRVALRWFGNHVVSQILCLIILATFVTLTGNAVIQVLLLFLMFVVYFMLMGSQSWQLGNRDANKVKFGHKQEDLARGFRVGFYMSIPLWFFGVALLLAKAELLPNFYALYKILNSYALVFINLIDRTFFGVDSAYLTVDSWPTIIAVFLLNVLPMLICGLHYILGYRDIVWMDKLIYKKKK